MPLKKYHSVEDVEGAGWAPRLSADNIRQAVALTQLAYRLRSWRWPAGLRRYRSIEGANNAREQWERLMVGAGRQSAPKAR